MVEKNGNTPAVRDAAMRRAFRQQADGCARQGSEFTARLCRLIAARLQNDTAVGAALFAKDGDVSALGDAVPLRLTGALHALVLSKEAPELVALYPPNHAGVTDDDMWPVLQTVLRDHAEVILERLLWAPQTNEVGRSGVLLPGFMTVAHLTGLPMVLSELAASAGLNMHWDRYAYRLGDLVWNPKTVTPPPPVTLAPDWRGQRPPEADCTVLSRAACDARPLDPARPEDRQRLLSYIWPDQSARLQRTRAAMDFAAAAPERVAEADAIDWLQQRLSENYPNAVHVIYHTIAWQYFAEETKRRGERVLAEAGARAGADAPLAWLRMEADAATPGAAVTLTVWPSGVSHCLARCDFHGRWIDWTGWPES